MQGSGTTTLGGGRRNGQLHFSEVSGLGLGTLTGLGNDVADERMELIYERLRVEGE